MLRRIGLILVVLSAVGIVAALYTGFADISRHGGIPSSAALALIFACCGMAIGFMLSRKIEPKNSALFWIAIFGVVRNAGLVVAVFALIALGRIGLTSFDNWWPPKVALFHDLLWSTIGYDTLEKNPELWGHTWNVVRTFTGPLFWTFVPLILSSWALWGRAGGLTDKLFAWLGFALAILVTISAIETGFVQHSIATSEFPPDVHINFAYIPRLDWYIFYAIDALLFTATGLLLLHRRPRKTSAGLPPSNTPPPPVSRK